MRLDVVPYYLKFKWKYICISDFKKNKIENLKI